MIFGSQAATPIPTSRTSGLQLCFLASDSLQMTSAAAQQVVTTGWWFPLLQLTAVVSAGLFLANLLPIPGLDGGRILFVILEAIRGRRISPEKEGAVHLVGMALLVLLMLIVTYQDVISPAPTINWSDFF